MVLEKTYESPLDGKEIKLIHPKGNQSWIFIETTDAGAPIFGHLMWRTDSLDKPWWWERLKAGEGDDRGWDGWMASPAQWTWVCASLGSWWWTGKPAVLQFVGSQRVRHGWATELNWYNGILLSHKKEWNNAICNNMDVPRDDQTKEVRERKTHTRRYRLYAESKRWHRWTSLGNRNRRRPQRTDLGLPGGREEGEWGRMGWEFGVGRCKLSRTGWINEFLLYSTGN